MLEQLFLSCAPLSDEEKNFLVQLVEKLDKAKHARLLKDVAIASVGSETVDRSRVIFDLAGYKRPQYRGQRALGVEARMRDADDAELSVLLHADENGRLFELEFIRWDSRNVLGPKWDTLKVW